MTEQKLPRTPGPPPPPYFILSLLAEWGLHRWLPLVHWLDWPWRWMGVVFVLAGVTLTVSAARLFTRRGTAIRPFEKSTALLIEGPFRFTRNPMYCGLLLVLSGEAILFGSLGPWMMVPLFWCFINYLFVVKEEACMRIQFGQAFAEYSARVRRWI